MSTKRALLVVLLLALVAVVPVWADSQARIVRLSLVNGPVQIDRATGQGFEKAIANMPITQGMKLRTDANSRAEVEFENGATMRLTSGAAVEFPELSLRSGGARASIVRVDGGTVYMNLKHKKDDDFRLQFAGKELPLDHSVRLRLKLDNGVAELAVFKGELQVGGPTGQATVKKNETVTLDLRDQDRYELARGITPESSDTWDADRIEYQEYYSSRYGNSPFLYGRSDLNYYGTWSYVSGYGNLWQPVGVGYGWDPFSNGYWAWYPGSGYTFVSGYPWGWTPYRYGSWVFIGSRGWCWRPGGWNTWQTLPPVTNAPLAFVPPTPPAALPGSGTPAPTVIVNRGPGRHLKPDPDGILRDGPGTRLPATDGPAPTVRTAPAGVMSSAPTTPAPAPLPAANPRGARTVPGPDGPVRVPPRMRDPDSGFRGGRAGAGDRPMRGQADNMSRGAAPASAPTPRASAPASAPAPRAAPPASSRPSRADSKASPH